MSSFQCYVAMLAPIRREFLRSLFIVVAWFTIVPALCATTQEKLANTMGDVKTHFAACIQPPREAEGSQVTFYFSLKSDGEVYGQPRIVWLGYKGSQGNRKHLITEFLNAFDRCLPLPLSEGLARTIPGKVYYLQFRFGVPGSTSTEVKLRPYGSAGFPLIEIHRHRRP